MIFQSGAIILPYATVWKGGPNKQAWSHWAREGTQTNEPGPKQIQRGPERRAWAKWA